MILIKILAAVFAAYEVYKLLHPAAFCALIEQVKRAGKPETIRNIILQDIFFRRVLMVEIAYMFFSLTLLFTPFWHFTVALAVISVILMFADTSGQAGRIVFSAGSAVLAALLMHIVMA